ncbi:MAG: hypothetical protein RIS47_1417 [Bacteroidota bacterium]|jgi:hypothetical protein
MRDGGDWIIYLFAFLFALHACITVGILIYRLSFTKEVKESKLRKKNEAKSE